MDKTKYWIRCCAWNPRCAAHHSTTNTKIFIYINIFKSILITFPKTWKKSGSLQFAGRTLYSLEDFKENKTMAVKKTKYLKLWQWKKPTQLFFKPPSLYKTNREELLNIYWIYPYPK